MISKSLLGFRIASNEIKEKAMTSRKLPAEMRKSSADIPWNSFISNIHSTQGRDRLAHQFPVAFTLLDRLAEVAPDRPPKRLEQELEAHFRDGGVEAALHACKSWKQELAGVRCSSGRDGDGDSPWTFRRCSHGTETEIRGGGGQLSQLRNRNGRVLPDKGMVRLQFEERQPQGRLHRTGRQCVPDLIPALERLSIPASRRYRSVLT